MVTVENLQKVSFPRKIGKAVGWGFSWKNCLRPSVLGEVFSSLVPLRSKPSGSVFWKGDAHSAALSKSKKGSGRYKEK